MTENNLASRCDGFGNNEICRVKCNKRKLCDDYRAQMLINRVIRIIDHPSVAEMQSPYQNLIYR